MGKAPYTLKGGIAWALGVAAVPAFAQINPGDELHFSEVPIVFTQNPGLFTQLLNDARTQTRRGLVFGDSQETSPDGRGSVYVPRLNYEIWTRYGNAPESPYIAMNSSFGSGQPYGDWLLRTAHASPSVNPSRVPPSLLPPGIRGCRTSTAGGTNVNDNQVFGQLVQLQYNAASIDVGTGIAGAESYFHVGSAVYLDVMAASNEESSGEIFVRAGASYVETPSYYAPMTQLFTSTLGLVREGKTRFLTQRFGPLTTNFMPFPQVELSGTSPEAFTDIITCKFVCENPAGITLTSLANGGYDATSLLTFHRDCGPVLAALAPDFAMIAYGSNDAVNGYGPAQFRNNMTQVIAFIRDNTRPDLPIILLCDPFRAGLSPQRLDFLDHYPGAAFEIALHDPYLCLINSRRLTDAYGWNATGAGAFMDDGIHYTAYGANLKAQLEMDALFNAFGSPPPPPCVADFNQDRTVDFFDYDDFIKCFEGYECPGDRDADFNLDGSVDFFDYDDFVIAFEAGC